MRRGGLLSWLLCEENIGWERWGWDGRGLESAGGGEKRMGGGGGVGAGVDGVVWNGEGGGRAGLGWVRARHLS